MENHIKQITLLRTQGAQAQAGKKKYIYIYKDSYGNLYLVTIEKTVNSH